MTDERATFEQTKARLEEILVEVKKKDTSLERSLDLLEEGVRLANSCNELIDQTSWRRAEEPAGEDGAEVAEETIAEPAPAEASDEGAEEPAPEPGDATDAEPAAEQPAEPAEPPADDERS